MPHIEQLSPHIANLIAAGEVVERPASVIKELMENSFDAGAKKVTVEFKSGGATYIKISDDGCGMSAETLRRVTDPFCTTRTTRKVGMGIPLFRLAAEQTGGSFEITSKKGVGTSTKAVFHSDSIDFTPLGDMTSTVTVLISMNTDRDFIYRRSVDEKEFVLDTREIKNILDGVPLNNPDVVQWMKEYIDENTALL